jgi:hypothetical protein
MDPLAALDGGAGDWAKAMAHSTKNGTMRQSCLIEF